MRFCVEWQLRLCTFGRVRECWGEVKSGKVGQSWYGAVRSDWSRSVNVGSVMLWQVRAVAWQAEKPNQ